MDAPSKQPTRFLGFDVHKDFIVAAAVDAQQNVVLRAQKVRVSQLEGWMRKHLGAMDAVVLEASANAWHLHDQLQPLVGSVTVAHPLLVKLIALAKVKTDPRDALHVARLLAAGFIPAVWVPPQEVRELRSLVSHRSRLIKQRTRIRSRLHSVLHRHGIRAPGCSLFAERHRVWWQNLSLSRSESLRVRQDLAILESLRPLISEAEAELIRLSTTERWISQVTFLAQLPGIGVLTAMILLSAIGDISRFPSARKLVGYSGLGAAVHMTGGTYRTGRITKQGRKEIRWAMIEAAWTAVGTHPHWKTEFQRLSFRLGRGKAIVAIARKLLVTVWHVLTRQVSDRHAEVEAVARKLMTWGARSRTKSQLGLSRATFVRQRLDRLQLGPDLLQFRYGRKTVRLPASRLQTTEPFASMEKQKQPSGQKQTGTAVASTVGGI